MNDSQELALVCGVLLACVAGLSILLVMLAPCVQQRSRAIGVSIIYLSIIIFIFSGIQL